VVVAVLIYLALISFEVTPVDIQATAYRLSDNSVLVYIRDYIVGKRKDAVKPFLFVSNDDLSIVEKQIVPSGIIESDRVILAFSKKRDKVWLFSPSYPDWVEWDIEKKKFMLYTNNIHPSIEDAVIMSDFKRTKMNN